MSGAFGQGSAFGDLGLGATGAPVSELQAKLRKLGFPVDVNGSYDEATVNAVRNLQTRLGMNPSGSLDTPTERALNQAMLQMSGGGGGIGANDIVPTPPACPRPLWQTALMWAGAGALVYGAYVLFNEKNEGGDGYRRALEPGNEEKDITTMSTRLSDGSSKCARTPAGDDFLKSPRVEA